MKKTKRLHLSRRASVETLARANLRRGTFTRRIRGGRHTLTQIPLTHAVAKRVLGETRIHDTRDRPTAGHRWSAARSCNARRLRERYCIVIAVAPAGDDGFRGTADRPHVRLWRARGGGAKLAIRGRQLPPAALTTHEIPTPSRLFATSKLAGNSGPLPH